MNRDPAGAESRSSSQDSRGLSAGLRSVPLESDSAERAPGDLGFPARGGGATHRRPASGSGLRPAGIHTRPRTHEKAPTHTRASLIPPPPASRPRRRPASWLSSSFRRRLLLFCRHILVGLFLPPFLAPPTARRLFRLAVALGRPPFGPRHCRGSRPFALSRQIATRARPDKGAAAPFAVFSRLDGIPAKLTPVLPGAWRFRFSALRGCLGRTGCDFAGSRRLRCLRRC